MAITVISSVTNNYSDTIYVVNTEDNSNNITVNPGQTVDFGAWTPWCTAASQFAAHHISVTAPSEVEYIYQDGTNVEGTPTGFGKNASNLCGVGNPMTMTVSSSFGVTLS